MANEKMTKDERETAGLAFTNAMKAVHAINLMHGQVEKLMNDHGWDIDPWEISSAAMLVANEGLGLAHSFGCEDGLATEVTL